MDSVELPVLAHDSRVVATLRRLYSSEQAAYRDRRDKLAEWRPGNLAPETWQEFAFPVRPDQGMLLYLLARCSGARNVVEFATSLGHSTIFLAAAVRDNGGGRVVTAEIVPSKVEQARRNIAEAGLAEFVTVLDGDARATLRDTEGPVDLLLLDGWPRDTGGPSLSLEILRLLEPQLRPRALVINDNGEQDYLEYVGDPENAFRTLPLPVHGGGHLSLYDPGS